MAKGPRSEHSPLSAGFLSCCDSEETIAVAVATAAESVREGISTPTGRKEEVAVARAEERLVGVDSRREERTEGSRPGGGSIP
jgi:hypothetical protein